MRVLIADDHMAITTIASELAKKAFEDPTVRIAHGVDELFEELDQQPIDLVVLDLTMPGEVQRIELVRSVCTWSPAPRILVYSADASPCLVAAVMENGAKGFVPKGAKLTSLLAGMKAVAEGESYIDPSIVDAMRDSHPWRQLTSAEREVLIAIVAGRAVKQIAAETGRHYNTVATIKSNGLQKLGLRASEELAAYFQRNGLQFELDAPYKPSNFVQEAPRPRDNVIELRPGNLSAADIETIDVIALMLLGIEEGHQQMEVTTKPWADLVNENGPGGSRSAAFRFPVARWSRGDSTWVIIDQGRVRVKIAAKVRATAMPQAWNS